MSEVEVPTVSAEGAETMGDNDNDNDNDEY